MYVIKEVDSASDVINLTGFKNLSGLKPAASFDDEEENILCLLNRNQQVEVGLRSFAGTLQSK